uniref:Reverse transcriptase zinc-binding domain-containing protein n=1 Tax=Cacopsylla melanoneura TaxID=428564 RepID=A0A8D8UWT2_9HEMI
MNEANKIWRNSSGMRHSKLTLAGYSKKLTQESLSLNRDKLRLIVSLLTGHGPLRKHLHRLGLARGEPINCRLCGLEEETDTHILFKCEALDNRRFRIFEFYNPEGLQDSRSPCPETDSYEGDRLLDIEGIIVLGNSSQLFQTAINGNDWALG